MKLTLGRAHELGLCVSLTAAVLIVLLGGAFPPWAWIGAFAPVLSMMLRRRNISVPGSSGTLLAVAALGAGMATIVRSGVEAAVFAGGATLVGMLAARVLTRRTVTHDLQAIALSLVLVLAGSVLNVGFSYFLVFVAYAVSTVWALATRQLLAGAEAAGASPARARERDDVVTPLFFVGSGAVSLAVLAAAVVVFVSFPRIGFGELGMLMQKGSRLPASVGFGSDPRGLSTSNEIVARLRGIGVRSFNAGLYLRGIVYDEVDVDAFSQTAPDFTAAPVTDGRPTLPTLARIEGNQRYEVMLNPLASDLLFVLGNVRAAQGVSGGAANPNRSLMVAGRDRHDELRASAALASGFRYSVVGNLAVAGVVPLPPPTQVPLLSATDRERHLRVPAADAALQALLDEALRKRGEAEPPLTSDERAARLRQWFQRNFRYSLDGELTGRDQPLRRFLLDVRSGHCELFAGAYALLLRMAGVPSRVIGGYQGGALADDGSIVFQQRHAHAWVEWWKDGVGWIVDDATPAPTADREELEGFAALLDGVRRFWDDRVLDYSLADQQTALSTVTNALRGHNLGKITKAVVVVVVVVGALVLVLRRLRWRAKNATRVDVLAGEILAAVTRLRGAAPAAASTLREASVGLPASVAAAVEVYEQVRFGGGAVTAAEQRRIIAGLRELQRPGSVATVATKRD